MHDNDVQSRLNGVISERPQKLFAFIGFSIVAKSVDYDACIEKSATQFR